MKSAIQVHDELQQTFVSGDVDAMLELFDENCVIREAPDLPFGGDWKGREGVMALSAHMAELFEWSPRLSASTRSMRRGSSRTSP